MGLEGSWEPVFDAFHRAMAAFALLLAVLLPGCGSQGDDEAVNTAGVASPDLPEFSEPGIITAPGLGGEPHFVSPLADAYRRIDPAVDGWDSETFGEAASAKLTALAGQLTHPRHLDAAVLADILAADFASTALRPETLQAHYDSGAFTVQRGSPGQAGDSLSFAKAAAQLLSEFTDEGQLQVELKLYRVEPKGDDGSIGARVLVHIAGGSERGRLQINSEWQTRWTGEKDGLRLRAISALSFEQVLRPGAAGTGPMLADSTASVLGATRVYREQFLRPTDHWRARIPRSFGLDVVANHGMALGDVDGDGLEDLYICQQGGLPNRLLLQNADGTLRDFSAQSGTDWLDYCASALLLDFDNDGDRDLAVSQDFKILFMDNLGQGKFEIALGLGTGAQTFSLSAADYDLDGDLDLYLCGYNPAAASARSGAMSTPVPYHDARNGGQNMMLRNEGNWNFVEVTGAVGLMQNNDRHSFAAAWEDYDDDGDPDLYVANDYGRNSLYRNDGGKFTDVAGELGVEDMSAGMSASWADYNRDGRMDLYVSNMFSAAGNRITFQRQFKEDIDDELRAGYQRHARGNSLFEGTRDGALRDVSVPAGVTMGRWAWGSRFADLDNDGWQDLVVANGFISAPDSGDL